MLYDSSSSENVVSLPLFNEESLTYPVYTQTILS